MILWLLNRSTTRARTRRFALLCAQPAPRDLPRGRRPPAGSPPLPRRAGRGPSWACATRKIFFHHGKTVEGNIGSGRLVVVESPVTDDASPGGIDGTNRVFALDQGAGVPGRGSRRSGTLVGTSASSRPTLSICTVSRTGTFSSLSWRAKLQCRRPTEALPVEHQGRSRRFVGSDLAVAVFIEGSDDELERDLAPAGSRRSRRRCGGPDRAAARPPAGHPWCRRPTGHDHLGIRRSSRPAAVPVAVIRDLEGGRRSRRPPEESRAAAAWQHAGKSSPQTSPYV